MIFSSTIYSTLKHFHYGMYNVHNKLYSSDIDECYKGLDECEENSTCVDTEGSYTCIIMCPDGYTVDKFNNCTSKIISHTLHAYKYIASQCKTDLQVFDV